MTKRATKWAYNAGILPDNEEKIQLGVVQRELVELTDEIENSGSSEAKKKEIADVFVSLNCLAETMGYTLLECLEIKMPILESRLDGGMMVNGTFVKKEDL